MPPKKNKEGDSKKSQQKKKAQTIEDKTFGLKNKNKSKKVQAHIQSVEKSVLNSGDARQRKLDEQRARAKAEAKAARKALKEEQDALFGAALLAIAKKGTTDQKEGKIEAKGRDADDDAKKKNTSRAMKMMFQMDAQEMDEKLREDPNYVPTLEDEMELQRQQKLAELKKSGLGTPVTEASFKEWHDRKVKARAEAAKKLVEAEMRKKKGGKGLAVLSGRDLYEYKKSLFDVGNDEEDVDVDITGTEEEEEVAAEGAGEVQADEAKESIEEMNGDSKPAAAETRTEEQQSTNGDIAQTTAKVESHLFLEGDDEDLDDLDDD